MNTCNHIGEIQLPLEQINNLYHLPSVEACIAYIHACLGFPTKAALLDAAATGRLLGIHFATVSNVRRFYPETTETPKGHMNQQHQGVRSTQVPVSSSALKKEEDVYATVWDLRETTYSDQTGRFPFTSYRGN